MDCWSILGVDSTADKKTIKLAYAKLLKVTRPDDDPEGFTRLHNAYKSALTMSGSAAPSTSQGSTAITVTDDDEVIKAPPQEAFDDREKEPIVERLQAPQGTGLQHTKADDPQLAEQSPAEHPDDRQEFHRDQLLLESKVQDLIESPYKVNKIAQWEFLETLPSMVDLNFRSQASHLIFDVVSTANQQSLTTTGALHVSQSVLIYLNGYLQWDNNWQAFVNAHGETKSNAVLVYLYKKTARARNESQFYFSRLAAFAIDVALGGACVLLAHKQPAFSFLLYVAFLYIVVAMPLLDASVWQGSIGKQVLNLKVVGTDGLRLSFDDAYWRHLATLFCAVWYAPLIWLNIYMHYKHKLLLQDWISKSYVVKRSEGEWV